MLELLGVSESIEFVAYIMLSLAFFVGIMLTISQEAFEHFNAALQKEYGIRKKLMPKLENTKTNFVDWIVLKYRFFFGILITVAAFVLLLMYKL